MHKTLACFDSHCSHWTTGDGDGRGGTRPDRLLSDGIPAAWQGPRHEPAAHRPLPARLRANHGRSAVQDYHHRNPQRISMPQKHSADLDASPRSVPTRLRQSRRSNDDDARLNAPAPGAYQPAGAGRLRRSFDRAVCSFGQTDLTPFVRVSPLVQVLYLHSSSGANGSLDSCARERVGTLGCSVEPCSRVRLKGGQGPQGKSGRWNFFPERGNFRARSGFKPE